MTSELLNTRGALHHKYNEFDAALWHYNAALEKNPNYEDAIVNYAAVLLSLRQFKSALLVSRQAARLYPNNIVAQANYAKALMFCGKFEESCLQHKVALRLNSSSIPNWYDYALLLSHLNRWGEAIDAFDKILELDAGEEVTDLDDPAFNLRKSLIQDRTISKMAVGPFPDSLEEYVQQTEGSENIKDKFVEGIPLWRGEPIKGKRVFVYGWGGYGDAIMCLRFLNNLKALGADITVAVNHLLYRLVAREGYKMYEWTEPLPVPSERFDYRAQLMWLPKPLGITKELIDPMPFLSAKPSVDIGPDGFRVGICWASGSHNFRVNWRRRYCPLELLITQLLELEIPDIRLVSLQKEIPLRDIYNLGLEGFIHVPMLEDFADTADVIKGLDLVIDVDSAVGHLAGALGVPVIMMGLYTRCWRWWNKYNGLPWYRNFFLADQPSPGDWVGAVKKASSLVYDASRYRVRSATI